MSRLHLAHDIRWIAQKSQRFELETTFFLPSDVALANICFVDIRRMAFN